MRQLLIINNIPSHYRTFMFNKMNLKGREFGIDVSVAFQAERQSDRSWSPDQYDMRFPYYISTGVFPWRKRPQRVFTSRTFNTDIVLDVVRGGYDWVLTAPFMSPGTWAVALTPTSHTKKLLWSESNFADGGYIRGPVRLFKRLLQTPFSVLVCPGERAVDYVRYFNPKHVATPVLRLPNLVDTEVYAAAVAERRIHRDEIRASLGVFPNETLVLGVGRMIELKGFSHLIEAAGRVGGSFKVILLGEGDLRPKWLARIAELGLDGRVHLPGEVDSSRLVEHLAAADWFVHTALHDSSPLVVIEAVVAGLPVAVSVQTGNGPEAVDEGVNGFTFDPSDRESMDASFGRMLAASPEELRLMGVRSTELARDRFDPDSVIDEFYRGLLELNGLG